jgi:hypothetical protein
MSKKEKTPPPAVKLTPDVAPPVVVPAPPVVAPDPPPAPRLSEVDKAALDLAKERRASAQSEVKLAQAKGENAELAFRYVVLQLYMKYGLTNQDALAEDGTIVVGGAVQVK